MVAPIFIALSTLPLSELLSNECNDKISNSFLSDILGNIANINYIITDGIAVEENEPYILDQTQDKSYD